MAAGKQYKVGVLGATGTVGQRFITLLSSHPFLQIHKLGASARSAGKKYITATKWKQSTPCANRVRDMIILPCEAAEFKDCDIVFSGLDSDFAGEIEASFREAGLKLFSNAKNYRRDLQVPLVVPTANPGHLDLVRVQQQTLRAAGNPDGFIVTNSNCSTAGLVVPLAAIMQQWPKAMKEVSVVTMQAISGAGYPGVPSLDIIDNVVPHIGGEEEKMEWESLKILGGYDGGKGQAEIQMKDDLLVTASCNRVAVIDGHLMCVNVLFDQSLDARPKSLAEIDACWRAYQPLAAEGARLPSAPAHPIYVHDDVDRPQPRLDREIDGGYAVSVGRLRPLYSADKPDNVRGVKYVCLVHNTVLGAAGMGILNAELAIARGYITGGSSSDAKAHL